MVAKVNVDPDDYKRLYAEGLCDGEIGKVIGFSKRVSRRIRKELGLAPNYKSRKKTDVDTDKFKRLYADGMSGKEAGLAIQSKLLRHSKIDEAEFLKHYQQGKNTKEIANALHVTSDFLYEWMGTHKYKVNRIKPVPKSTMPTQQQLERKRIHEKRLELYNKGLSDIEIAAEFGEKKTAIKWLRHKDKLLRPSGRPYKTMTSAQQQSESETTGEPEEITAQQYKNKLLHPANPEDTEYQISMRLTSSLPKTLLDDFNKFMRKRGYATCSEAVREAIRKYISDYERTDDVKGYRAGTAVLIYDHTKNRLSDALIDVQNDFSHLIRLSVYNYFGNKNRLEVVVLDREADEIKKLDKAMKALVKIEFSELTTVSLAK